MNLGEGGVRRVELSVPYELPDGRRLSVRGAVDAERQAPSRNVAENVDLEAPRRRSGEEWRRRQRRIVRKFIRLRPGRPP